MAAAPLVLILLGLGGCSDYDVARSELSDEAESAEIALAPGDSAEVVLRLEADAEAMAANPTNWVDITIFAVRVDGTPVVSATALLEQVETAVPAIEYLELVVDSPMRRCADPGAEGPETTHDADGTCVVRVPVALAAVDGTASVQVTAHYELAFGRQDPPGAMAIGVEE